MTFVAPAALDDGLADALGLRRRLVAVTPTRDVGKADMINNDALPAIEVDPETFAITIDGELVEPSPADGAAAGPAVLDVLMARSTTHRRCCSPTRGCPSAATPSPAASSRRSRGRASATSPAYLAPGCAR